MTALPFDARALGEEVLRRLDLAERYDAIAGVAQTRRRERIYINETAPGCSIESDVPRSADYGDGPYVNARELTEAARRHRSMAEALTRVAQVAAATAHNEALTQRQATSGNDAVTQYHSAVDDSQDDGDEA